MPVAVIATWAAHSLSLLSGAAQMLTDAGAIGLSYLATRLAIPPAARRLTSLHQRHREAAA